MKRVLFFVCLSYLCCACSRPDDLADLLDGYVFHDEFSYLNTGTEIYEINKSSDNYYLIVKSSDKDEVLKELDRHGFIVTMQPEAYVIKADDYYLPQILEDCEWLCVQGEGSIDAIPRLVFSHNLYKPSSKLVGRTNMFHIWHKENETIDIEKIYSYADLLGLHVINVDSGRYYQYVWLACTNESLANPIEAANFFVEKTEYKKVILFPEVEVEPTL